MSLSTHGFTMSRSSQCDVSLRPILASMDNMTLGPATSTNPQDGKPRSKPPHQCQECNKGLKATSFSNPSMDSTGVCCQKCYTKNNCNSNKVYCDECMQCSGDICATCHVFFCQECLDDSDRMDLYGNRYCSEKCAPKHLSSLANNSQPKDYEDALGSMGAKLSVAKQLFGGPMTELPQLQSSMTTVNNIPVVPAPVNAVPVMPTQSDDTEPLQTTTPAKRTTMTQPTPQSTKRKGCAWCRQSLKTRTTGPKSQKKTVGYYCNCNNRKVYCDGCAINHGDFCQGACLKFVCKNCVPYDAWFRPANKPDDKKDDSILYCSQACVPEAMKAEVVRRTLFDDDEDWEAEEYIKPLGRRCQGMSVVTGERCKITASHPCAAAKSLKKGDDYCLDHGGCFGFVFSDDDSFDDGDFYFSNAS